MKMPILHELDPRQSTADPSADPTDMITEFPAPIAGSGASLITTAAVMMFLTGAWTAMRIVSRRIRKVAIATEDYLYFTGFALFWATAMSFILVVVLGGAGNDMVRLSPEHLSHYFRIALVVQVLYGVALGFIKLSIICMLRRIFRTTGKTFLAASWAAMAVCVLWAVYTAILPFVICTPVESAWGAAAPVNCGNMIDAYAAVAILDIITELSIVALPLKMVYDLQLKTAHKIGLYGIFGAGLVTIIFSCLRLYYVYAIDFDNITKSFAEASIASAMQGGIAVMVASSPTLRPVFDRTVLKWLGVSVRSTGQGASSNGMTGTGPVSRGHRSAGTGLSNAPTNTMGLEQMSGSEEHLAWEMHSMGKSSARRMTSIRAARTSNDSDDGRMTAEGRITVVQETVVESRSGL